MLIGRMLIPFIDQSTYKLRKKETTMGKGDNRSKNDKKNKKPKKDAKKPEIKSDIKK